MVLYNVDDVQDLFTDSHWVPSVNVTFSDGVAMKEYIADNGDEATVEITDGEEERKRGNTMAAFSSRGPVGSPASDDVIKPDVTAPGVQILAGNSLTPTLGVPGELFQSPRAPRCQARMSPGFWHCSSRHIRTGRRPWPSRR